MPFSLPSSAVSLVRTIFRSCHLLFFSALLGTELYQSFIIAPITFRALPRLVFLNLQKRLFPVYFQTQAVLLLLTVLTYQPNGIFSLVYDKANLLTLSGTAVAAGLNLFVYGPRTREIMLRPKAGRLLQDPRMPCWEGVNKGHV